MAKCRGFQTPRGSRCTGTGRSRVRTFSIRFSICLVSVSVRITVLVQVQYEGWYDYPEPSLHSSRDRAKVPRDAGKLSSILNTSQTHKTRNLKTQHIKPRNTDGNFKRPKPSPRVPKNWQAGGRVCPEKCEFLTRSGCLGSGSSSSK